MTTKIKTVPVSFKAGPEDGLEEGEFIVYPSTFTRIPDAYGDVVAKGAFLDTIAAWEASGNTLPGLYGHRMDDPDYFVAHAIEMSEDDHGWRVKGVFDLENPKARQTYKLVKGRRLNQLSFAYDVVDAEVITEDGERKLELRKLDVHEFSFVPIGANRDTSVVAIKAPDNPVLAEPAEGTAIVQGEASGSPEAKEAEEPTGAKASEEPQGHPSVDIWAAKYTAIALIGQKGA